MSFDFPAFEQVQVESKNVFARLSSIFFYPGRLFFGRAYVPITTENFRNIAWENTYSAGLMDAPPQMGTFYDVVWLAARICLWVPGLIGTGLMQLAVWTNRELATRNLEARKAYVYNQISLNDFHEKRFETQKIVNALFTEKQRHLFCGELWERYTNAGNLNEGQWAANLYILNGIIDPEKIPNYPEVHRLQVESQPDEQLSRYLFNADNYDVHFHQLSIEKQIYLTRNLPISEAIRLFKEKKYDLRVINAFNERIKTMFLANDFSAVSLNLCFNLLDWQWLFEDENQPCLTALLHSLPEEASLETPYTRQQQQIPFYSHGTANSFFYQLLRKLPLDNIEAINNFNNALRLDQLLMLLCSSQFDLINEIAAEWNKQPPIDKAMLKKHILQDGISIRNEIQMILFGGKFLDKMNVHSLLDSLNQTALALYALRNGGNERVLVGRKTLRQYPPAFVHQIFFNLLGNEQIFENLSDNDLKKILIHIYGYEELYPIAILFEDSDSSFVKTSIENRRAELKPNPRTHLTKRAE